MAILIRPAPRWPDQPAQAVPDARRRQTNTVRAGCRRRQHQHGARCRLVDVGTPSIVCAGRGCARWHPAPPSRTPPQAPRAAQRPQQVLHRVDVEQSAIARTPSTRPGARPALRPAPPPRRTAPRCRPRRQRGWNTIRGRSAARSRGHAGRQHRQAPPLPPDRRRRACARHPREASRRRLHEHEARLRNATLRHGLLHGRRHRIDLCLRADRTWRQHRPEPCRDGKAGTPARWPPDRRPEQRRAG